MQKKDEVMILGSDFNSRLENGPRMSSDVDSFNKMNQSFTDYQHSFENTGLNTMDASR